VQTGDLQDDRVDNCKRILESDAFFVELTDDERHVIRCPPLEKASVFPHVEPPRRRSLSKKAIIDRWISIASKLGRFEEVGPQKQLFISEVVLVHKTNIGAVESTAPILVLWTNSVDPDSLTDQDIRKHFRVTLDLRKVNSLKLYEQANGEYVWLADSDVGKATPTT
ncbi:hypothetical protein FOL47_006152, partial [Perkinsus chesapeaki]